MNAEELALTFDKYALNADSVSSHISANTWRLAAIDVRQCITPSPLEAAAPDMLAALEDLEREAGNYLMQHSRVMQQASAAIAKAKGTSDV